VAARAAAPPPPQAPLTQKRSNSFSQSFRRAPHMYHFPQHPLQTLLPTTNILTVCCLPAHSSPSRLPNGTGHVSHVTRSARSPSPGPICMVPEDPQAYRKPESAREHGSISNVLYSIHNDLVNGKRMYLTCLKVVRTCRQGPAAEEEVEQLGLGGAVELRRASRGTKKQQLLLQHQPPLWDAARAGGGPVLPCDATSRNVCVSDVKTACQNSSSSSSTRATAAGRRPRRRCSPWQGNGTLTS